MFEIESVNARPPGRRAGTAPGGRASPQISMTDIDVTDRQDRRLSALSAARQCGTFDAHERQRSAARIVLRAPPGSA
jgi:hypothetical protein